MSNKIVLISDDSDFFEYIKLKLELRTCDELLTLKFDEIPSIIKTIETSALIINSENSKQKTLDLLTLFNGTPSILIAYNDDETFKKKCYRAGAHDFITLLIPDSEFRARILPVLNTASILEKNYHYRQLLVKNKIVSENNEVFVDYEKIIDNALDEINKNSGKAVFGAVAPDEKSKFFLKPNQIETVILSNIRKNDILMNYTPSKYFLLMYDTDISAIKKLWKKIASKFQYNIYAGFVDVKNQKRQQLINSALNKLSEEINSKDKGIHYKDGLNTVSKTNFKLFRIEFAQKLEKIVTPVFYTARQKYINKIIGVKIESEYGEGYGAFNIIGKHIKGEFRISSPGFSKILVDISVNKESELIDSKRIPFEPEELEAGLLGDLLEQFISETVSYINKIQEIV